MGLFDVMFRKPKESTAKKEVEIEESFIESADKAALLVSQSVESGDIASIGDKLKPYIATTSGKNIYVFNCAPSGQWVALLLLGSFLSLCFLLFLPVAAGTYYYSSTYKAEGLFGLLAIAIIIVCNIFLCGKAIREIRFSKRYDYYRDVLKYRNIVIIDDLSNMVNINRNIVTKDLKKAVRIKLIPQGHFGMNELLFMVSEEAFANYLASEASYNCYFEKTLEKRGVMQARSQETEELLAQGEECLARIKDCNDIIKDKDVSDELDQMEKVVSAIFHEADVNPSQANRLGVFINRYLPTIEKLLKSYIDVDEKKLKGNDIHNTQKEITQALDLINSAFESLLERFYEEQEIDMVSDISAMNIVMNREDLKSAGTAAN